MSGQIQALPQNLIGTALVTALNDRIRTINDALNPAAATGAAAPVMYGTHAERIGRPVPADGTLYFETDTGLVYLVEGTQWVSVSPGGILYGTHHARVNGALPADGTIWRETDRSNIEYQVQAKAWVYTGGVMSGLGAAMPADLGVHDKGLPFYATDRQLTYQWSGTVWVILVNYEPVIADTLARWTAANYNPATYAAGQQFLVTTWQATYTVEGGVWTYTSGVFIAVAASRPATGFNGAALGAADKGLRFLASDTGAFQYWTGAAWAAVVAPAAPPIPQHQTDVTAARAIGTVYQNTLGTPIFFKASVSNAAATNSILTINTSPANPPGAQVDALSFSGALPETNYGSLSAWVLPGSYYRVLQVVGASALIGWVEWS